MIRKILFCGLIAAGFVALPSVVVVPPLAQAQPAPKPSPQPSPELPKYGTREYTEAKVKNLTEALKSYDEACNSNADFQQLEEARSWQTNAATNLINALTQDIYNNNRAVRQAADDFNHAQGDFKREQDKKDKGDYVKFLAAEAAYHKAEEAMYKVFDDAVDKLLAVVDPDGALNRSKTPCPRHQAMRDAREKAQQEARMAAYEKMYGSKPAPSPSPAPSPPAKTGGDCNKGTGLTGAMEKEACEEGKK